MYLLIPLQNDPCVVIGGMRNGTCYTAEECQSRGIRTKTSSVLILKSLRMYILKDSELELINFRWKQLGDVCERIRSLLHS